MLSVPCKALVLLSACSVVLSFGCVPIPGESVQEAPPSTLLTPGTVFPGLDPGAKEQSGLHFKTQAYGSQRASQIADMAEAQYNQIMMDTGLYSFMPSGGLYSLVVYSGRDEYLKKTRQPDWSGGLTINNAIYGFDDAQFPMVLAHEMTHLLFHEFMGTSRLELRWLNEGLAVYEEAVRAASLGLVAGASTEQLRMMREQPIPFDQMVNLVPATERERTVNLWYQQVGSVVRFLIERGGRNGMGQLLLSLKNGQDFNAAVRAAFPGVWNGTADLESSWRRNL